MAGRALRRDQLSLAAHLRAAGQPWPAIAATLAGQHSLNGRVAMRLAHGWSQAAVADRWNVRWPDEPKTFKNISYWENWPGPTGYTPSLQVLDRLATIYECDVADLLAGWGEHRAADECAQPDDLDAAREAETLAWQVSALNLQELTVGVTDWSRTLPLDERKWLLLKLSTAAAAAAAEIDGIRPHATTAATPDRLAGHWQSRYTYASTSRGAELDGVHEVDLHTEHGRVVGRSRPHPTGSELSLELTLDGMLASGTWSERTSPSGHYRAALYRGTLQLVLDPTGRSLSGRWLGLGKRFVVNSGEWNLNWLGPPDRASR